MRLLVAGFAALVVAGPGRAAVPEVPTVTAGTSIKNIRLDWQPSAGASWYEVWYRASAGDAYQRVLAKLPAATAHAEFRISVHLLDWEGARYRVAACNVSGCTQSTALSVAGLRMAAAGYFKSAQPRDAGYFGDDVDLSPNGANFVASQPNYFDWLGEPEDNIGTAHVFRRRGDGTWYERGQLRPALEQPEGGRDMRVAINASGNRVVMGMPAITHSAADANTGEVYVFTSSGSSWTRTRIPTAAGGRFGSWVGIDDGGDTIAIRGARDVGIYRLRGGTWTRVRSLSDSTARLESCPRGLLTRDGSAVIENCYAGGPAQSPTTQYVRIHSGAGWSARTEIDLGFPVGANAAELRYGIGASRDGGVIAAQGFDGALNVQVFRSRAGVHEPDSTQHAGAWQLAPPSRVTRFGESIAVSGGGKLLAVGDTLDLAFGYGVLRPPISAQEGQPRGAVYVYRYTDGHAGAWSFKSLVRVINPFGWDGEEPSSFGTDVALCATGAALLVAQPRESGSGSGVDGNRIDGVGWPYNGAAILY